MSRAAFFLIASFILTGVCFMAERKILADDPMSSFYSREEAVGGSESERKKLDYEKAAGLTAEEFEELYGDGYTLMYWASEYSDDIPDGRIIRVEDAWGFYQGQAEDGKRVLNAYYSKGPAPEYAVCDFRNLVDCDEYFSSFGKDCPMTDNKYIVSHNEFYMSDGQLCTVDITSPEYYSGETALNAGRPAFSGKMHEHISLELGGGVITPCAFDSGAGSAVSYSYNDHFSLLLDDYNGDGDPDFVIRTCDISGTGSYYYMEGMTPAGRANSLHVPSPKKNADSSFYVYGTSEPSIRLDRIDRETVFFLTKDGNSIYPVILGSDLREKEDIFSVNGRLYSSFYENGTLKLKCTCLDIETGAGGEKAKLSLKKLNGRMWEDAEFPEEAYFRLRRYRHSTADFKVPLDEGVYRMEIFPESGGMAYTEFTVNKNSGAGSAPEKSENEKDEIRKYVYEFTEIAEIDGAVISLAYTDNEKLPEMYIAENLGGEKIDNIIELMLKNGLFDGCVNLYAEYPPYVTEEYNYEHLTEKLKFKNGVPDYGSSELSLPVLSDGNYDRDDFRALEPGAEAFIWFVR